MSVGTLADLFDLRSVKETWSDYRMLPGLFLGGALLLTMVGAAISMNAVLNHFDDERGYCCRGASAA